MTRTTGKQAVMELLRAEQVKYVFGIPGATEIHFMDAIERNPDISYMLGLHEVVCVGMAEGLARTTGRPAVLNLHTATGLAAASPLLYNAQLGRVPMVVTVGQNDTRLLQHDPRLTGDIVGMGRIHGKWSAEPVHAEDLPVVMRRAFKMAAEPPAGPVVVSLPQDVLQQEFDFEPVPPSAAPARTRPDTAALARAVAILAAARRPLLLIESGVARSGAMGELVKLAETIGAGVYQAWMADVNFPVDHPQYLGDLEPDSPRGQTLLSEADVLVGVGCALFPHGFMPGGTGPLKDVALVHIDDDAWEIDKNLPTECGLLGDIKTTLQELNDGLDCVLTDEYRARVRERTAAFVRDKAAAGAAWEARLRTSPDTEPLPVLTVMRELARAVGPDTAVVDEAWSASAALRQSLPLDRPDSFFRARNGGSIGSGLPMALGVKLGLPDKQVLAVVGDGSAAWSLQSLWTAARYAIPVTFVITNNTTYGQVKLVRQAILGDDSPLDQRHEGMDIDRPVIDFAGLAQAMGVRGERVMRAADLAEAVRGALASGEPRLVEVMVETTP